MDFNSTPLVSIIIPIYNVENYLAAFIATKDDVKIETMKYVSETFVGVEHRCELVREIKGVKYYNSLGSYPTLSTGENADSKIRQKCDFNVNVFN